MHKFHARRLWRVSLIEKGEGIAQTQRAMRDRIPEIMVYIDQDTGSKGNLGIFFQPGSSDSRRRR